MNLKNPDVYVQDTTKSSSNTSDLSIVRGLMLGRAKSGPVGEPVLVHSFTEYVQKFANGLETPFMTDDDLTYAVYGFFANGGKELYVVRLIGNVRTKANFSGSNLSVEARYVGEAGNNIAIEIKKNILDDSMFDLIVYNEADSTVISGITNDTFKERVESDAKANSWIVCTKNPANLIEVAKTKFTGGSGNNGSVPDGFYEDALKAIKNKVTDAMLVAIPGKSANSFYKMLVEWGAETNTFPLLDTSVAELSVVSVKTTVNTLYEATDARGGAMLYPWGNVVDPITNELRATPPSGHVMGIYARILSNRGIYKLPAGTDAVINGFVSLAKDLSADEISILNTAGVVPIQDRPNMGPVVWGGRALVEDNDMKYVSDVIMNYSLKQRLFEATLFAVFEPNTESLWSKVTTICSAILEDLRLQGALKGKSKDEAYYVVCDSTINTEDTVNSGMLNIEIGYANVKPAEFVVIKLAHTMSA